MKEVDTYLEAGLGLINNGASGVNGALVGRLRIQVDLAPLQKAVELGLVTKLDQIADFLELVERVARAVLHDVAHQFGQVLVEALVPLIVLMTAEQRLQIIVALEYVFGQVLSVSCHIAKLK